MRQPPDEYEILGNFVEQLLQEENIPTKDLLYQLGHILHQTPSVRSKASPSKFLSTPSSYTKFLE